MACSKAIGDFSIAIPEKYVSLNLNIFYKGFLKTTQFEEQLFDEEHYMGVIEISIIDQEERENAQWLTEQVTEADSGEKIEYAIVYIQEFESRVITDAEGRFRVPITGDPDSLTIEVNYFVYEKEIKRFSKMEWREGCLELKMTHHIMLLGGVTSGTCAKRIHRIPSKANINNLMP